MTSIRDALADALAVGEQFRLDLEERDGTLVADHPSGASPMDVAVLEGVDRLEERPPTRPVTVEILDRTAGDRVVGRIVADGEDQPPADRGAAEE